MTIKKLIAVLLSASLAIFMIASAPQRTTPTYNLNNQVSQTKRVSKVRKVRPSKTIPVGVQKTAKVSPQVLRIPPKPQQGCDAYQDRLLAIS